MTEFQEKGGNRVRAWRPVPQLLCSWAAVLGPLPHRPQSAHVYPTGWVPRVPTRPCWCETPATLYFHVSTRKRQKILLHWDRPIP